MKNIVISVFLFLIMLLSYSLSYASCFKEGDKVNVTGQLKKEFFYGPPGWGEEPEHDKKLTYWILTLDKPFTCVIEANNSQNEWGKNIQLIMGEKEYERYRQFMNKHVSITGRLFLAQTGYHMTPVLLDSISSIAFK